MSAEDTPKDDVLLAGIEPAGTHDVANANANPNVPDDAAANPSLPEVPPGDVLPEDGEPGFGLSLEAPEGDPVPNEIPTVAQQDRDFRVDFLAKSREFVALLTEAESEGLIGQSADLRSRILDHVHFVEIRA